MPAGCRTANDPVLHDFLMRCFQKDPLDRADAQSLSEHRWLLEMRESIESQEGALSSSARTCA